MSIIVDNETMNTLLGSEGGKACKNSWRLVHGSGVVSLRQGCLNCNSRVQQDSPGFLSLGQECIYNVKVCVETARSCL